jgi:hypothetical protein
MNADHVSWIGDCADDPKDLCLHGDAFARNGYGAFWNEWRRRRGK